MLKGIHPLLHPELLHALASMGHGDEIVIADANFPSASIATRLIHVAAASSADVLSAVLTLLPLDTDLATAAVTMKVISDNSAIPEAVKEFAAVLKAHEVPGAKLASTERSAFYARAREAFAVVRTADMRPYANILLVKGVVNRYPTG